MGPKCNICSNAPKEPIYAPRIRMIRLPGQVLSIALYRDGPSPIGPQNTTASESPQRRTAGMTIRIPPSNVDSLARWTVVAGGWWTTFGASPFLASSTGSDAIGCGDIDPS